MSCFVRVAIRDAVDVSDRRVRHDDFTDNKEGMMRSRSALAILSAGVITAVACSSQPTAPSSTDGPAAASSSVATAISAPMRFGDRDPGAVYVTSQGLYYDTFVVKDPLPMHGKFQLIANGQTEFGPGDPGYLGGRWWEDTNGDGMQDSGDHFFLCPLLPPGRTTP
jgi:hypothetical protein